MIQIAFRNVFRHRVRSAITLMAIGLGAMSIVFVGGFFEDTFMKMRESYIHAHTGHLQLYQRGFLSEGRRSPYKYLLTDAPSIIAALQKIPSVESVSPRLQLSGVLSNGRFSVSCFAQGVESPVPKNGRLKNLAHFEPIMVEGRSLEGGSLHDVILGQGLAASLNVHPGDSVTFLTTTIDGAMSAEDFNVRGVFFTSAKAFDDHFLRLPLPMAQQLLRTDRVQSLVVLLDDTRQTTAAYGQVSALVREQGWDLEMRRWEELNDFYFKTRDLFLRIFWVLKWIIALIILLSIYNTLAMNMAERIPEIGTLMAMGDRRGKIVRLFVLEGLVLGVTGGALGALCGVAITWLAGFIGIPMPPPPGATMEWTSQPVVVPAVVLVAFSLSVVSAVLSSILPAWRASRLEIATALRTVA